MRFRQQRVITNLDAEKNFAQAETEFDSIASEQAAQQAEIDALELRVDGAEQDIDDLEAEDVALDARLDVFENVEPWIEVGSGGSAPAFQNSWVNFGSGLETAGFYKDPLGIVHVKGVIKSGTTASCFQLPAGYRPAATEIFACQGNNGSNIIVRIDVGASGNIGVQTASATFLSLSGITFRAA